MFILFFFVMYIGVVWFFVVGYVFIFKLVGLIEYGFIFGYVVCIIIYFIDVVKIVYYSIVVFLFFIFLFSVVIVFYYNVFKIINYYNFNMVLIV